jgi:hypothetical protein
MLKKKTIYTNYIYGLGLLAPWALAIALSGHPLELGPQRFASCEYIEEKAREATRLSSCLIQLNFTRKTVFLNSFMSNFLDEAELF